MFFCTHEEHPKIKASRQETSLQNILHLKHADATKTICVFNRCTKVAWSEEQPTYLEGWKVGSLKFLTLQFSMKRLLQKALQKTGSTKTSKDISPINIRGESGIITPPGNFRWMSPFNITKNKWGKLIMLSPFVTFWSPKTTQNRTYVANPLPSPSKKKKEMADLSLGLSTVPDQPETSEEIWTKLRVTNPGMPQHAPNGIYITPYNWCKFGKPLERPKKTNSYYFVHPMVLWILRYWGDKINMKKHTHKTCLRIKYSSIHQASVSNSIGCCAGTCRSLLFGCASMNKETWNNSTSEIRWLEIHFCTTCHTEKSGSHS